jgi:hypothetical protein
VCHDPSLASPSIRPSIRPLFARIHLPDSPSIHPAIRRFIVTGGGGGEGGRDVLSNTGEDEQDGHSAETGDGANAAGEATLFNPFAHPKPFQYGLVVVFHGLRAVLY